MLFCIFWTGQNMSDLLFDSFDLSNLAYIKINYKIYMFGSIQSTQTRCHPYSYTSPYKVSILWY